MSEIITVGVDLGKSVFQGFCREVFSQGTFFLLNAKIDLSCVK